MKINYLKTTIALLTFLLSIGFSTTAFGAATIVIAVNDAAGVGFNDMTVAVPVGGNPGTTLGQQRLNAFQEAANIWGATLTSSQTITIRAQWAAQTCTATTAVLGSAGATTAHANFSGAVPNSWYGQALGNKLSNSDLNTTQPDINATFNINLGQANCLTGTFFYLGLDGNHGANVDLVAVLLHEFGHGLGFQTFTNGTTGVQLGTPLLPSIYDRFLLDNTTGKSWVNMTNTERVTSAVNSRKLVWDGPQVQTDAPSVLSLGVPLIQITAPSGIAGNYDVGTASFGPALTAAGLSGVIVQALDVNEGTAGATTTDGCSALTNAAAVSGKIALIDRGVCGFAIKTANAQAAGAIAVVIADNVAGGPPAGLGGTDPTITIPAVRVTLADGNAIKAQLAAGVSATLKLDNTILAGTDAFGKTQVYTPNPFQSGSSVSHWDTIATRNLLMEPAINADLTHLVTSPTDLTFSLLRDIGWTTSTLPTTITTSAGNAQSVRINRSFATPLQVTVDPAVPGLIVTFTAPASGAGGTFANSGSRPDFDVNNNFVTANSRTATAVTDGAGIATAPVFSANGQSGTYTVNATVPGAGTTPIQLTNLVPTAAHVSISGRVINNFGSGLSRASIIINQQNGTTRTAVTNSFGYYTVDDLIAGETLVMSVRAKGYQFNPQVLTVLDNLTDFDFIALP